MRSVVLLSGGLDSTVALAITLGSAEVVDTLTVEYGQSHVRELEAASAVADYYKVPHTVVRVDPVLFGGSALTGGAVIPDGHADDGPDSTYVPARNTVLLALAAARAESVGAAQIVIGANADDEAGYPDCRWEFIEAYRSVLSHGTLGHVWVSAPLLRLTKKQIAGAAMRLGVPVGLTWSCYRGGDVPCGRCGACESREGALACPTS